VEPEGSIDLYWIPLGAGAHVVRASGRLYEWAAATLGRRRRCELYHAALVVSLPEGRYAIEQAPVPDADGRARGVVATGPVGVRAAGRLRLFRYEVRCWLDGTIPDLDAARSSPVRVADGADRARRAIAVLPSVPTPTWGRDEFHTGEMWNSNSVVAWVLARSGVDVEAVTPPPNGRAPGWGAGVRIARSAAGPGGVAATTAERRGRPRR